jgi:hypothetical protein
MLLMQYAAVKIDDREITDPPHCLVRGMIPGSLDRSAAAKGN